MRILHGILSTARNIGRLIILWLGALLCAARWESLSAEPIRPTIQSAAFDPNGAFQVSCLADASRLYRLEKGASVATLDEIVDVRTGINGLLQLVDPHPSGGRGFYRVRAIPNSENSDSDGDGIPDITELAYAPRLNPLDPLDASLDPDADGFTTLEEIQCGADPFFAQESLSAEIVGRVVDTNGVPVSGATVAAYAFSVQSKTQADGSFRLAPLPRPLTSSTLTVAQFQSGTRYLTTAKGPGGPSCSVRMGTVVLRPYRPSSLKRLDAGLSHSVALRDDSTLWSWGNNAFGQLGRTPLSALDHSDAPLQLNDSMKWAAVSADKGSFFLQGSIGVTTDGRLWSWGTPSVFRSFDCGKFGFVCSGWFAAPPTGPLLLDSVESWGSTVEGGLAFWLMLTTDGRLFRLGASPFTSERSPSGPYYYKPGLIAPTFRWRAVAAGFNHILGITTAGELWAWGENSSGQIGVGHLNTVLAPTRIGSRSDWVSVAAGTGCSFAIAADGSLWGWGENSSGALGDGTTTQRTVPAAIGAEGVGWEIISTSGGIGYSVDNYTLGLRKDGSMWMWGTAAGPGDSLFNPFGYAQYLLPRPVRTNETWLTVSSGHDQRMALRSDGELIVWGLTRDGLLGDGAAGSTLSPQAVEVGDWSRVSSGHGFFAALRKDGSLWTRGDSYRGQLGRENPGDGAGLGRVASSLAWKDVACGDGHAIAIRSDGTLWAWGENRAGQLGIGNIEPQPTPTRVDASADWLKVDAAGSTSAAMKQNGSVWGWGALGTNRTSPLRLSTSAVYTSVTAGQGHVQALRVTGEREGWGFNFNSELGLGGSPPYKLSPISLSSGTRWIFIDAGWSHTTGILSDGSLWAWGLNDRGAAGFGWPSRLRTTSAVPIQIGLSDQWTQVSAGGVHNLAIRKDGRLFSWGDNTYGALGNGVSEFDDLPAEVQPGTKWRSASASMFSSAGIREDGSLWAWGLLRSIGSTRVAGGPVWGPAQ